ncbi:sulfite exporter TauE/SafE family protein [Deinococcus cavernae]|uniref:Probable membrane transporter protein n=1 Tax=Deinococcus cavernae TaxID=2320857 RepID=A0A418V740_9DEIO|nr:sulfite exporter TauE/SafE family protein [Deinococcus cavernae]RJF71896.1 sulfite exporter TauE/SafE family protein [Deinococcus cavernae]
MILAWMGAALIGLSLGLLGSGGSILTVPVLVYLVGEETKLAITESLAIVGSISLFGMLPYARKGLVNWPRFAWFGVPGLLGTTLGASLSQHMTGSLQLTIFAVVMLLAAFMMFRPGAKEQPEPGHCSPGFTALQGLGVGLLTGVVGVGGGFLIIPALVLLGKLPMKYAVGTSLAIITLNSYSGFAKHVAQAQEPLHWPLILIFAAIGIAGSWLGSRLGQKVSNTALRKGFAAFLVVMGAYVLGMNAPKILHASPVHQPAPTISSTMNR